MARSRGRRRYSRRWFLGALGASAGAAGLAALGCGDEEAPAPPAEQMTPEATAPAAYPTHPSTPAPLPTREGQATRHGGTLRYAAALTSDREFDPHKTTSGALLGEQALIYSRLLTYESQVEGRLVPDLATGMPEQPDELTYIFRINPEARWHDIAPLNGRAVTAQDVVASVERQRADFPRRDRWDPVASMEAEGEDTVIVRTETPFAGMLARFASPEGFIVPLEAADDLSATVQVGSGPFRWVEWSEGSHASVARNDAWHGPDDGPFLDGLATIPPRSVDELEADFRTREVDAADTGFLQARELKERLPDLREARSAQARFYGMRFLSVVPPFDDPRVRRALTIAINRRELLERFFHGRGTLNPWISAAVQRWSLPQEEMQRQAGYLPGSGGRELDIRDAQTSLAAYREEHELTEPLELLVTANLEETLGMGGVIARQIGAALQLDVQVTAVGINELARRLREGEAPWALGVDRGWIELDDWLYPYFHSGGGGNTFVLRDEEMDAQIEEQRAEMATERRQELAYQLQRRLLQLNVAANFVSQDSLTLFMPYVQLFPVDAGEAHQDRFANTWIDRTHPTYAQAGGERGGGYAL